MAGDKNFLLGKLFLPANYRLDHLQAADPGLLGVSSGLIIRTILSLDRIG